MKTKAMIRTVLITAAALAITPLALAADSSEKELKTLVPNGTFKKTYTETVNNIKMETYEVMVPNQPAGYATVTENGDLLASANPHTAAELPPAVAEVTTSMFGSAPTKIWALSITEYSVSVKTAKEAYAVKINAAGVITGIDTNEQLSFEDPKMAPKADAAETAGLDKLIEQRFAGAKVTSINKSKAAPGFFVAEFTHGGKNGWIVLNKENRVRSYSMQIPMGEVPKPVLAAAAEIKGATVTSVSRYTYNCWDVTEPVAGDTVDLRVRPDGSVISIESTAVKQMKESMPSKKGK